MSAIQYFACGFVLALLLAAILVARSINRAPSGIDIGGRMYRALQKRDLGI